MISARPASFCGNLKRGSSPSAVIRAPTVPLVIAEPAQDRVHPGLQFLELAQARAAWISSGVSRVVVLGAQRPGIEFVAVRARPQAGCVGGAGALRLEFGELAFERGDHGGSDGDAARCAPNRPGWSWCA